MFTTDSYRQDIQLCLKSKLIKKWFSCY
uniref:Uncharacterized protein n=1 Tax=Anguilla anguilla TaxID=7936 RepID=A0A0E9SXP2_ANGAN